MIVGKPYQPIVGAIVEKTGYLPDEIIMVGDRLYTDIALGKAGLGTVLVLSGESKVEDILDAPHPPDLIGQDLDDLYHIFLAHV